MWGSWQWAEGQMHIHTFSLTRWCGTEGGWGSEEAHESWNVRDNSVWPRLHLFYSSPLPLHKHIYYTSFPRIKSLSLSQEKCKRTLQVLSRGPEKKRTSVCWDLGFRYLARASIHEQHNEKLHHVPLNPCIQFVLIWRMVLVSIWNDTVSTPHPVMCNRWLAVQIWTRMHFIQTWIKPNHSFIQTEISQTGFISQYFLSQQNT